MDGKVMKVKSGRRLGKKGLFVWQMIQLTAGALIVALSFNLFLLPNGIASGGVAGLSILVQRLFGVVPAFTQWAVNIPLFAVGVFVLGKRFGMKTAFGSIMLPLFILLTGHLQFPTDNPLLAAIFGGLGVGAGLGLVLRGGGSTGGFDLASKILHHYTGLPLSLAIVLFDGCVVIASGFVISPEIALYALIGLFVTSKTIDFMQTGLQLSKVAFIITNQVEETADAILHELDRGLTRLQGYGGFTGADRIVLMVVVSQNEVSRLKQLVGDIDREAFIILSNTAEVLGQGFKWEQSRQR